MSHEKQPTPPAAGGGGSPACNAVTPCCAHPGLAARIVEIKGLYQPGVDDRTAKPPGTSKNSGYQAGYISLDNQGRIFTNRALDCTWSKDHQYIEIAVKVDITPGGCPLLAGTKIKWTIEDPDDPTNDAANVHPDAGQFLDPNDYTGGVKTGAAPNDNNPRGKATAVAHLEEVDPLYALTGSETLVDPGTMRSIVRFHVSDVAGDNYRIQAEPVHPSAASTTPAATGVMTVWHRIEIEYVKMASALELPVDLVNQHYAMACVQVDVSLKRVVTGASDMPQMGLTDGAAFAACNTYTKSAGGEFTHEGQGGWFCMVAANRMLPAKATSILWEGDAQAFGNRVRLPAGALGGGAVPAVIRVFNSARVAGMPAPKPNDRDLHIKFGVVARSGRDLRITPHDFHEVHDPMNSFLNADLSTYGFADGTTIPVQVMSAGDEALVTSGISPGGVDVGTQHYFGGKLLVFSATTAAPDVIKTLCHELCHAFDNAHKCGNWDWQQQANRTSCCMNYWFQFVLDNASPRAPILWTQNRPTSEMCGPHLTSIRDYHLEDNPGLGW